MKIKVFIRTLDRHMFPIWMPSVLAQLEFPYRFGNTWYRRQYRWMGEMHKDRRIYDELGVGNV